MLRNTYAWLRSQHPRPRVKATADLVGTSLVMTPVSTREVPTRSAAALTRGRGCCDRSQAYVLRSTLTWSSGRTTTGPTRPH